MKEETLLPIALPLLYYKSQGKSQGCDTYSGACVLARLSRLLQRGQLSFADYTILYYSLLLHSLAVAALSSRVLVCIASAAATVSRCICSSVRGLRRFARCAVRNSCCNSRGGCCGRRGLLGFIFTLLRCEFAL